LSIFELLTRFSQNVSFTSGTELYFDLSFYLNKVRKVLGLNVEGVTVVGSAQDKIS